MMAIICNTRRAHYEHLIDYYKACYYEHLLKELRNYDINLESIMTVENFNKSCEYHKTFALVYNNIVLMMTSMKRENFVDFTEDEYRDFAEGNRSKFVFDYMLKDSFYKECLVEGVQAVVDHFYEVK